MRITDAAINSVRVAVSSVTDPEYPDLNLQQLGILEDVVADSASIRVDLVPTILGCPALDVIKKDVMAAAREMEKLRETPNYKPTAAHAPKCVKV